MNQLSPFLDLEYFGKVKYNQTQIKQANLRKYRHKSYFNHIYLKIQSKNGTISPVLIVFLCLHA